MNRAVAHISIDLSGVRHNDSVMLEQQADFSTLSRALYDVLDCSYPKFFKMDELSKLGFLSAELLLSDVAESQNWEGSEVALAVGNKSGSMLSDIKHQHSINDRENYFPSPAVFVYTLSNIMLGEICIRHKILGENSCFLMEEYDAGFITDYVNYLFEKENYKFCICGWIENGPSGFQSELWLLKSDA